MNIQELMYDAFSTCRVINGEIKFLRNYSKEEFKMIYDKFSEDLLDFNIPHYRVIGVMFKGDPHRVDSMVRVMPELGISRVAFMKAAQKIIPARIGGNDINKVCYLSSDEPVPQGSVLNLGWDTQGPMAILQKFELELPDKTKVLVGGREEIGQLKYQMGYDGQEISTDTLHYNQLAMATREKARYLLPNQVIHVAPKAGQVNNITLILFYWKGTGFMDFKDTQKFFTKDSNVNGCRVKYDLTEFVSCRIPKEGDTTLKLSYFEDLDETVLEGILRDYGKGMVTNNGSNTETD